MLRLVSSRDRPSSPTAIAQTSEFFENLQVYDKPMSGRSPPCET